MSGPDGADPTGPFGSSWTNGLLADSYVPLVDVDQDIAPRLLIALQRARIAAYLAETSAEADALRLYVASAERSDARVIVASVVRAASAGAGESTAPAQRPPADDPAGSPADTAVAAAAPDADPLAGIDTDAAFAELVADWHVDTHRAIREAERALSEEDELWRVRLGRPPADEDAWLDEDHYVPPAPPPLPRLTVSSVLGIALVVVAVVLLGFGGDLGLPFDASLFLGVAAALGSLGLLVMHLRDRSDEDDDGAIV